MRRPLFSFAFREERKNSVRPLYPFPSCTIFCTPKVRLAMKKCLVALAFGTLGLGMSEFGMMGILTFVASGLHVSIPQAGIWSRPMRWGLHRCAADGRRGAYAAVETYPARIGGADGGGEPLCGVRSELRCAAGDAVRVRAAARSLFRGRVDRCGMGSRPGPERTGRGGDDRRHDGGQSLRRAAGNAGQPPVVVAGTVLHRRRLGCGDGFFSFGAGYRGWSLWPTAAD